MAKPIEGIPVLKGKDAAELRAYLEKAKPDPKKAEQNKADIKFARSVGIRQ